MLSEQDHTHYNTSLSFCTARFGKYALFAILPLCTALVAADKEISRFIRSLKYSRFNPASSAKLHESVVNLGFQDSDCFTIDEIRVLMQIQNDPYPSLSDREIDKDTKMLKREARLGINMLGSHAQIVLKAIEYWTLRRENLDRWLEIFDAACREANLRREVRGFEISTVRCPTCGHEEGCDRE